MPGWEEKATFIESVNRKYYKFWEKYGLIYKGLILNLGDAFQNDRNLSKKQLLIIYISLFINSNWRFYKNKIDLIYLICLIYLIEQILLIFK